MPEESARLFQNLIYAGMGLMVVYTLWTVLEPILQGDKVKKRMGSVTGQRESLKAQRFEALEQGSGLRQDGKGKVRDIVERFSLETLLASPDIKEKMAQAGIRGQKPLYYFYMARMVLPIAGAIGAAIWAFVFKANDLETFQKFAAVVGGLSAGYYAPGTYVKNKAAKRLKAITPVFPDALDLLLICVESGMSVELAFAKVAEEMAEASIELAEEFSLTTAELSYLNSRRVAYENLARRNNYEGIRSVATALVQAERYGTPLGATLRTLSSENRQMRVLAAEKKAAQLPAKLTVPMMIFFLPVLFIVLLTPAAMRMKAAL